MSVSIQASGQSSVGSLWPKSWPPVQLPPPSPLDAAAASFWSAKNLGTQTADTSTSVASQPLYSTQLRQNGNASTTDTSRFQVSFLDQRIALVRWDTSHTAAAA